MNVRFNDPRRAQRELLSGSQFFAGLSPALLDELIAASRLVELSANQALYEAGEPIREAHLLFHGSVKRSATIPGGATKVIELVQSEQLLSLGEIFGATHYASTCCGITQALLVAIDIRKLREATQNYPDLSCRIITALARRQFATEFDVTSHHYGLTGAQRLLDYLLETAGERAGLAGETTVVLKASKKVIAARIGMTPESLSRNLRELSDNGVIVVDGRKVHIQNAALLDTVSGDTKQRLNFGRKRKGNALTAEPPLSVGTLVNMCGRLRVLSQRMAIAWGMMVSAIAPHKALIKLRQLDKEFERNLARLDKLELAPDLTEKLALVKLLWPRYQQLMDSEEISVQRVEEVFELSEELLEATDALTGSAAGLGGLPEAHYVNMAGRNRMLSQRIGKFFLFREWASLDPRIAALIPPSCLEFESNLQALGKTGNTPPEVAAQLRVVASQWQKFIRSLCPDLSHAARTQHARLVMAEGERLLRSVDTTVKLFERLTK
ncbi:MAG: Cyclic nucleotide-binding protein [Proteobacteria bacterium]|nr:Cyclic nucleotide-binding protein [Pseudomonadota bacterium]